MTSGDTEAILRELREAHENDPGFKFTDDARYRRVLEEYHARDMMLL